MGTGEKLPVGEKSEVRAPRFQNLNQGYEVKVKVIEVKILASIKGLPQSVEELYFMLFGSLSENNGGLSLDNFTVSSSEIIIHRANRLFSNISRISIVRQLFYGNCRDMGSEARTFNL